MLAALYLLLVVVLNARRHGVKLPGLIGGFLSFYILLSLVAYILSPIPDYSGRRLTAVLAGAAGYGLVYIWLTADRSRSRLFASGLALAGGVLSLAALFIVEWPSRFLVDIQALTNWLPHLGGDFYLNNNTVAGVLLLLLPLALALFLQVKNWTRVFYLIATISMAIMLFLTQSRNAYLGVFFAIIAGLLWGRIRFRFVMLFVAFLLVMPFAAVGLSDNGELGGSDLISTVDMSTKAGSSLDQSWLSRLEIWSAAVQTMGDYPVVGAGLYTFAPVSRANYVYQVLFPNIDISHAHNLFLQTGASLGWAGWLAIAGLWVSVMYALWGAQESDPASNRWLPRALSAGIAGYIVFNSFDVLALEQWAGITVWLVLALASAVIERSGFKAGRYRWLWAAPMILLAAMLIFPFFPSNLARLQVDRARWSQSSLPSSFEIEGRLEDDFRRLGLVHYLRGERDQALRFWRSDPESNLFLFNQGQQAYLASREIHEAIEWYSLSLAIDGEMGESFFWRGDAYRDLGENEQAMADYLKAIAHGTGVYYYGVPLEAVAWARIGQLYLEQDELLESILALEQAVSLAPNYDDFRQQLQDIKNLYDLRK